MEENTIIETSETPIDSVGELRQAVDTLSAEVERLNGEIANRDALIVAKDAIISNLTNGVKNESAGDRVVENIRTLLY